MCLVEVNKGALAPVTTKKYVNVCIFYYKYSKWQTEECNLDSQMRLTIETFKINNPAAATRAPSIVSHRLLNQPFTLMTIVATSSQETFNNDLLTLMLSNTITSISSSCHLAA